MRAAVLFLALAACHPSSDPKAPSTQEILNACAAQARNDVYVGGMDVNTAWAKYEACKKAHGL